MKMHRKISFLLASLIVSTHAFANWQVSSGNNTNAPREPFFQTGRTPIKADYKGSITPTVTSAVTTKPITTSKTTRKTYSAYLPSAYQTNVYPRQHPSVNLASPVYAVSISGSLKDNIERIMGGYHWKVIWKAPYDYNFDGRITGSSLPSVIEKLLQPFPLQAQMYMSNRTLAIVPRNQA